MRQMRRHPCRGLPLRRSVWIDAAAENGDDGPAVRRFNGRGMAPSNAAAERGLTLEKVRREAQF